MHNSLLERIQNRYGACSSQWAQRLEIAGKPVPLLSLPAEQLEFNSQLGFWPHLKILTDGLNQRWFVLQLASFELANGPGHDWAIPFAYEPRDEDEAIRQELGFDEGWEESRYEHPLLFDQSWTDFFAGIVHAEMLALTVEGAGSCYPVRFQSWQLQELRTATC